jgi:hypothetical protein
MLEIDGCSIEKNRSSFDPVKMNLCENRKFQLSLKLQQCQQSLLSKIK